MISILIVKLWRGVTALDFSRFVIDLCFLSVYSLVDSSVGDHQHQGPGGHQDQRGLGPRVSESCAGKQVRIVINRYSYFVGPPNIFNRLFKSLHFIGSI